MCLVAILVSLSLAYGNSDVVLSQSSEGTPAKLIKFQGVEFAIPVDWTTENAQNGLLIMCPKAEAGWQANIFVECRTENEPSRSLEKGLADLATNLQTRKPHFEEINRKIAKTHDGLGYGTLQYSTEQDGTKLTESEIVFVLNDTKRLFILASSASAKLEKYTPIFNSLINSVQPAK